MKVLNILTPYVIFERNAYETANTLPKNMENPTSQAAPKIKSQI